MSALTLEERVAVLEAKIEELNPQGQDTKGQDTKGKEPHGWKHIVGIFADNPEFEEAVRAGKEWRDSFRPSDYEETSYEETS